MKQVTEMEHSVSELAVCAVRYALGRRTYVTGSVPRAVMVYIEMMTDNALANIAKDVGQWLEGHENDGIDWPSWKSFHGKIESVQRQRAEWKKIQEMRRAQESKATKER